jgi:hypothetical protein
MASNVYRLNMTCKNNLNCQAVVVLEQNDWGKLKDIQWGAGVIQNLTVV